MNIKRRGFLQLSGIAAGSALLTGTTSCTSNRTEETIPSGEPEIKSIAATVPPITDSERIARIEKAQRLMAEQKVEAIILDAGTSMTYFTGIRWWPSERPMVAIVPARGDVCYICPGFEESRLQELITVGKDIYAWQEDESPYAQMARALKDRGTLKGKVGIEERVRFFIVDGLRKEAPHLQYVSADAITGQCRLIKSPAEIALMQAATMATVEAMKMGIRKLEAGMAPSDFSTIVATMHEKIGGRT